ncbi:hypothetical protein HDA40_004156 [Hamadaea flava]|uniref:Uncharacterized protein n=1 Tax=Hamadaea flava TaxID=1742688 RepID=A0ABV8LI70_9ACTN|nr:hypothetical protein [Hamadaea flava]MCP2325649.1 hypothetical protein [Hamadaea flava]
MITRIYELVTGTPWTTGRSAVAEFGPTIATRYPELAELTDRELCSMTPKTAIAYAEAQRANTAEAWERFDNHLVADRLRVLFHV